MKAKPDLDPATLRWVADELDKRRRRWERWLDPEVRSEIIVHWEGGAHALKLAAAGMRARATRIERKRGRA